MSSGDLSEDLLAFGFAGGNMRLSQIVDAMTQNDLLCLRALVGVGRQACALEA